MKYTRNEVLKFTGIGISGATTAASNDSFIFFPSKGATGSPGRPLAIY
jgi:hypothetical protein